jgi:hypothetical protein
MSRRNSGSWGSNSFNVLAEQWKNHVPLSLQLVQSSKLLLVLSSIVILGFGPRHQTYDHIFVLKWGLLFDERRGHSPSTREWPAAKWIESRRHSIETWAELSRYWFRQATARRRARAVSPHSDDMSESCSVHECFVGLWRYMHCDGMILHLTSPRLNRI